MLLLLFSFETQQSNSGSDPFPLCITMGLEGLAETAVATINTNRRVFFSFVFSEAIEITMYSRISARK